MQHGLATGTQSEAERLPPLQVAPAALPMPAALRPFETGVWLWCVLVLNVANLIMAHERWARSGSSGGPPLDILAQLPLRVRLRFLAKWIGRVSPTFSRQC
jgi:hypothetical protein